MAVEKDQIVKDVEEARKEWNSLPSENKEAFHGSSWAFVCHVLVDCADDVYSAEDIEEAERINNRLIIRG